MKKIIFISLFTLSLQTMAQEILSLRNGEKINFKKRSLAIDGSTVKLKTAEGKKMSFDKDDVIGYCSVKEEKVYTIKRDPGYDDGYYFVERVLDGDFKLYSRYIVIRAGQYSSRQYFFYLEKGNDYRFLYSPGLFVSGKKAKTDQLKSYVEDNPDLVKYIESEEFMFGMDDIKKVINEYNVSKFTKNTTANGMNSSVFFYLKDRRKNPKPLKVVINDVDEYDLPEVMPVSIGIPLNQSTKVCVNNQCQILQSSPCYIKYIEIMAKKDKIEFDQVESIKAKLNIFRADKVKQAEKE